MIISMTDVENMANLARLALSEAEKRQYQEQLSAILTYADKLNELELGDVPPTASAVALHTVLREDVVQPSLPTAAALANAAATAENQFQIQTVLDD